MVRKPKKIIGFDFIRVFAVYFIFLAHILGEQLHNEAILLFVRTISPGLTMSALGLISGYLLSSKNNTFNGLFFIKRFVRIYSSLIICLIFVSILHASISYDVVNQHSIIHFMGLSFFLELLSVTNKSSIGNGLWFITVINGMYLLLPMLTFIYKHKNSRTHLVLVVLSCLFFDQAMYGTASSWNVIIAFNIGCYSSLNSNIEILPKKPFQFYTVMTLLLLTINSILTALAIREIIPWGVRSILFPFYPLFVFPFLYKLGSFLSAFAQKAVRFLSSISYEVYILHFYFINRNFSDLFPSLDSVYFRIVLPFLIVIPLSYFLSKISVFPAKKMNDYFISENAIEEKTTA